MIGLVTCGLLLEGCLAVMVVAGCGPGEPPAATVVAALLAAGVCYLAAAVVALRAPGNGRAGQRTILTFTLVFALTLLGAPPVLDDDLHRYLWEGKVLLSGINPYLHSPSDPALDHLREAGDPPVGYPDLPTPYPPGAQLLFALMRFAAGGTPAAARVVPLIFFLATLPLTAAVLEGMGADRRGVILYAWNPLVLKEFANSGHLDAVAVFLTVAAVLALMRRRAAGAGILTALAVGVKLYPLFIVPFLARRAGGRGGMSRFLIPLVSVLLLLWLPFAGAGPRLLGSLGTFGRWWLFNHGPYQAWEALWGAVAVGPAGARTAWWLLAMAAGWVLAWTSVSASWRGWCTRLGVYLFLLVVGSPVVMPWYLAWGLPFLSRRLLWSVHAFTAASALSYLYYLDHRDLPWARGLEYGLLLLGAAADLARRGRASGEGRGAVPGAP
jgi:hypothetical protein